jgi:secernin
MCDTLCAPGAGGMVFAKNSDRPVGEVQLAVPFGRRPTAGCTLRTQYLSIGDTGAHAAFLSCPTWLWGAEHGINEFGVAIGNERVHTVHDAERARPALIGMDLVRLGLERARGAPEAVEVLIELLTTHGQGGVADAAHGEAYDSSFLIADARDAFVLDTSGQTYAVAPFFGGTAISNRFTVGTRWTKASPELDPGDDFDRFRNKDAPTDSADVRRAAGLAFLNAQRAEVSGLSPAATAAHLRDHGHGPWGAPGPTGTRRAAQPPPPDGAVEGAEAPTGASVCMHVPQRSVTAASLIAVLPADLADGAPLRAYVALGSPCVSIYVPAFLRTAAGAPPFVPFELSSEVMWRAADVLRQHLERDPLAIGTIREVLDPIEDEIWQEADDVAERPDRWADVGSSWGPRALGALQACAV